MSRKDSHDIARIIPHTWRDKRREPRCQHTKSSLMSVQSVGSLEGTPSLVPVHHVPNTDCFTSSIPRRWWRPRKGLWVLFLHFTCFFGQLFLFFRHECYKLQSKDRVNLGSVTCLLANIASAPKSVEPTWLASSTEDSLYVFRPVC